MSKLEDSEKFVVAVFPSNRAFITPKGNKIIVLNQFEDGFVVVNGDNYHLKADIEIYDIVKKILGKR